MLGIKLTVNCDSLDGNATASGPPHVELQAEYGMHCLNCQFNLGDHQLNSDGLVLTACRAFLHWAELKGPSCPECVELAQLFSQGVDSVKSGAKTKVPSYLKRPPPPPPLPPPLPARASSAAADAPDAAAQQAVLPAAAQTTTSSSTSSTAGSPPVAACGVASSSTGPVWLQLRERARGFVHNWYSLCLSHHPGSAQTPAAAAGSLSSAGAALGPGAATTGLSLADMLELMDIRDVAASEFDLFRLAVSWVAQHGAAEGVDLVQMVDSLDFSKLTPEQVGLCLWVRLVLSLSTSRVLLVD